MSSRDTRCFSEMLQKLHANFPPFQFWIGGRLKSLHDTIGNDRTIQVISYPQS